MNRVVALTVSLLCFVWIVHAKTDRASLQLSEDALDALNAGVALSFQCEYAVRSSWWFLPRNKNKKQHYFTLARHTLSHRYVVKQDDMTQPHIFRSTTEASQFINTQAHKLLESYSSVEQPYSMRVSLNRFVLPAPMRLRAFLSSAWDIDSGWIKWDSAN